LWAADFFVRAFGAVDHPFAKTSGTSINKKLKVSSIGNKEMKRMLHLAAVGSARLGESSFKNYYAEKSGKAKTR
jgi:Transposase IS116/IS110/IS902 family